MSLTNCGHCGKLMVQRNTRIHLCEECFSVHEDEFRTLKKALRDHPGANVMELSGLTGISPARIMYWVREGRIQPDV